MISNHADHETTGSQVAKLGANKMTDKQIIETVKAATALHRESKHNLVVRMRDLLDPVSSLTVGQHRLEWQAIYAQCSQWGDHSHAVTNSEGEWVIDGKYTLGQRDLSFFDGHNQQYMFGPICSDASCEDPIPQASATILREIARDLPAALLEFARKKTEQATAMAESVKNLKSHDLVRSQAAS